MADPKPSVKAGAKHHGLKLSLPGAPATPHMVQGVLGWYWPDRATPVGGPGELSEEYAKTLAADPSIPLELVELSAADAESERAAQAAFRQEARAGVIDAIRGKPVGDEVGRVVDERAMTAKEV